MKPWSLLVAALLAAACTVKEDRSFCPAWCVLYSDGHVADGCVEELVCNVTTVEQGCVEYGHKDFFSFTKRGDLVLEVPRNEQVYVDVICGVDGMNKDGDVLAIPMGFCCDCIYSGHGSVFISGEEGEAGLPLNKDFATISMKVAGDVPENYPFSFRLIGNVDGFLLPGGKPHEGEFDYSPTEEPGHIFHARVPRQIDDSLMLEIYNKGSGILISSQKLGEMIRDIGYDWKLPDLPDIYLGVDMSEASFTIEVESWEIIETIKIIF